MKSKIVIILLLMLSMTSLFAYKSNALGYRFITQDNPKATGGVINESAKLIIQTSAFVVISGAGNYTSSGSGSMPEAGTLDLSGNFINNNSSGEPVSNSGSVMFTGTAEQSISGNPISFGNVTFANPAGISIACDTDIAGNLLLSENSGTISMTDYDFGVTGNVSGTPEIVVNGSGAVGEVGENANVTIDSPQPSGIPPVMNTLDVNPGLEQTYQLPNSSSVASLTFTSGTLSFGDNQLLLRTRDIILSGSGYLSALSATLSDEPGEFSTYSSINKTWNITGFSSADLGITLRWRDEDNNGNDFSSGYAKVFANNGTDWQSIGRFPITIDGEYNLVSFTIALGAKDGVNDYTVVGDNQTLPVELSSLTAIYTVQNNVLLRWITQSESNLQGFYVYRNGCTDISNAVLISGLLDPTNSSSEHSYDFVDSGIQENGSYYYWLYAQELTGVGTYHGPVQIIVEGFGGTPETPDIPLSTGIKNIFPNPFNPSTTISYQLKSPARVTLEVFNARGQLVNSFSREHSAPGNYTMPFNGTDLRGRQLSSGVYQVRMSAGNDISTQRVVLMK